MMSAENGEGLGESGVPLCSPEERLIKQGRIFEAAPRVIPNIGEAVLYGSREGEGFSGINNALALLPDRVVRGTSDDFYNQGFYLLQVWLQNIRKPFSNAKPLVCQLTSPLHGLQLRSPFKIDKDEYEPDPMKQYNAATYLWGERGEYILFAPKDPKVLSLPHFKFSQA